MLTPGSAAAAARVSASLLGWNSAGALSTDYRMATGAREQRLTLTVSNGVYRAGDGENRYVGLLGRQFKVFSTQLFNQMGE